MLEDSCIHPWQSHTADWQLAQSCLCATDVPLLLSRQDPRFLQVTAAACDYRNQHKRIRAIPQHHGHRQRNVERVQVLSGQFESSDIGNEAEGLPDRLLPLSQTRHPSKDQADAALPAPLLIVLCAYNRIIPCSWPKLLLNSPLPKNASWKTS